LTLAAEVPHVPLLRLRCSRSDVLRRVLERVPAWGHVAPGQQHCGGDRGVSSYRLAAESCFVQVHWRLVAGQWEERDYEIVPGTVVALRLVLDDADPQQITRLLGLEPLRAFGKGESGPHNRRVRDEGIWIYEVMPRGFHWPEEKVGELLSLLRGRPGWRDVLSLAGVSWAGVTVELRGCLERMGGFALDPAVLEDLVRLSLQLDLKLLAE
jgi:hypothetical protein